MPKVHRGQHSHQSNQACGQCDLSTTEIRMEKNNLGPKQSKQSTFFHGLLPKNSGEPKLPIDPSTRSTQGDQPSNKASRDNEGLATLSNRRGTQHPVWNIGNDSLSLIQSCGILWHTAPLQVKHLGTTSIQRHPTIYIWYVVELKLFETLL